MVKVVEIKVLPSEADVTEVLVQKSALKANIPPDEIGQIKVIRRSIDARGEQPLVQLRIEVYRDEQPEPEPFYSAFFRDVSENPPVIIVGAGPAGYFAALELLELGLRPLLFDRGKDVRTRRRDLRAIQQFGIVNCDSNYCFGEGGAGAYSDGKLYTRSHKRGHVYKALKLLVEHGANPDILIDAHPHIGSNKLPGVVANIRETIIKYGGLIHFEAKVTNFILEKNQLLGVIINDKEEYFSKAVILATGHSARDIFLLLRNKNIQIEAKPFALGVRVEHPQSLIDSIQYRQSPREAALPAASYKLVTQVENRGVFSFCMCPGGLVVPAATEPEEIVVNGMSMSRRDSAFANSGIVVQVELADLEKYKREGVFQSLTFQQDVEKQMFSFGNGTQKAPAQKLTDFVHRKSSSHLNPSSYIPGLIDAPLHKILPEFIYNRLRKGFLNFGKLMKGYYTDEANVIAVESRTSSPVRIPRDNHTLMHTQTKGLFPCGEGAGYAGGIISAAMDGQNVARAVAAWMNG
jgi:hypothetical protein